MRFPPFQERLLQAVLPVCGRYGLVLAGGYAIKAHGFTDRPSRDLDFATAMEVPLPDVADGLAGAFQEAGLKAEIIEVTPRMGRMLVEDPVTGETCEFDLLREALQQRPITCGTIDVLGLDDAVGLKMRAVHERSLARDLIDIAAVAHLYPYRALEQLAAVHHDSFSVHELLMRLEYVELMDDEAFEAYGLAEERVREIRRFVQGWVEDIKLRRADDGDVDYDADDVPEPD
ncbi:nucleotidyl transferase AbiEii/AbiGii toxin family protein [Actinomadura sp. ATCC 31491]|uniref:Nucleotidyl transferase AbiEii/AbiGii toxin family protein n=1 Tax=Actinomadura luzonensis TaxID=2805427 RepID=A0ABT0GBZ6_9ACTN|nr:nucleotidyl transferase AbiEii/AbiGii toxin family protein [Actinomadura luzonensis]MCK2221611.1 nucleotidyl transferase AbiEii/AbiGii toxin family protein [Actinomadura luzonensis]